MAVQMMSRMKMVEGKGNKKKKIYECGLSWRLTRIINRREKDIMKKRTLKENLEAERQT